MADFFQVSIVLWTLLTLTPVRLVLTATRLV